MSTWFSTKVAKRESKIEGRGLFCTTPITSDEAVVVKGGHVFDRAARDVLAKPSALLKSKLTMISSSGLRRRMSVRLQ